MPKITHRLSHTKAYEVWHNMQNRCDNPKRHNYDRYGGRGITYCESWKSFENFYADMGEPPKGYQLDRRDNDKGYSKENCRWVPPKVNHENRGIYKSNTSGLPGLHYEASRQRWRARLVINGMRQIVYTGPDLFEAACKLLSWRNRNASATCSESAVSWF